MRVNCWKKNFWLGYGIVCWCCGVGGSVVCVFGGLWFWVWVFWGSMGEVVWFYVCFLLILVVVWFGFGSYGVFLVVGFGFVGVVVGGGWGS